MRVCWCGSDDIVPFAPLHGECRACGTLVRYEGETAAQTPVLHDETDFYGKNYWLEHQHDLNNPDIFVRARNDLTERNLHWLRALLKYRMPPADVLELGCVHGSFVALMQQAGYHAIGVEMSPWVIAFAEQTFGVHVLAGPVESADIPSASLDAIVLMDVLEHLPNPVATIRWCWDLLRPDGLLLIQTPQFREGMNYEIMVESKGSFLDQLKDEHLYLFSERSVETFFRRLGAEHIHFEPAAFAHYDMFLAVSRTPCQVHDVAEVDSMLLATPNGRITLALLDLARKLEECEVDRAARFDQIVELTRMVKERNNPRWRTVLRDLKNLLLPPSKGKL